MSQTKLSMSCRKHLPDALIIGVKSNGLSGLKAFLSEHSRIKTSGENGVWYFNRDGNYDSGTSWYLENLPCSSTTDVIIEETQSYFHGRMVIM